MGTLHAIKARLYDNPLTENPNDFIARVDSERTLNTREVCESAVTRGGADTTADRMEHDVGLFFKEMSYRLCDGFFINTGYFSAGTGIRGVFNSPHETFNPDKHSLFINFNQGALLRQELSNIQVEIIGLGDTDAKILEVEDVKTGSVNDVITPSRNLRIRGSRIKLAGDNEQVGVSFVSESTGEVIKVDSADVVVNKPAELIILTPDLPAGAYRLQIVTQYGKNVLLKEPRTALFDEVLTVVS
ncbi:DNA-binding domain-containing protein [Thermophagus sp. OGC60D27]|uniref:DNA-binding domain-containing protein n=1 Tax=Thermophagus sp. OGC60D27 TaxID=3458415 RepID=UPI00403777FB